MKLTVDKNLSKAVYVQIADGIVAAIKNGSLQPRTTLPSTRQLCSELKINRNTVVRAFEILSVEGWISNTERHGTIVSKTLPLTVSPKTDKPHTEHSGEVCQYGQTFWMTVFPTSPIRL